MVLRHFYIFRQSPDRISEVFFWPLVDILIWGLTSVYFANLSHFPNIVLLLLSGLILWTFVYRSQQEIPMGLLEELWNKNLINIFSAPLTFSEWIISTLVIAILKTCMSFSFIILLAYFLYKLNIFVYGLYLIPFLFLLTLTAWSVGFFVTGLILRYSTKVQTLAWSLIAVISPFSGIYYSVAILPWWAQKIALLIPLSYIFQGMREVATKGSITGDSLWIALALNIAYLILALLYFRDSFKKVLQKGLVKVF